jgi:hypothetical protein
MSFHIAFAVAHSDMQEPMRYLLVDAFRLVSDNPSVSKRRLLYGDVFHALTSDVWRSISDLKLLLFCGVIPSLVRFLTRLFIPFQVGPGNRACQYFVGCVQYGCPELYHKAMLAVQRMCRVLYAECTRKRGSSPSV